MNNISHSSSWGRILLMLKSDFITHKKLLYALVFLFVVQSILPRFSLLFGVSLKSVQEDFIESYSPGQHAIFAILVMLTTAYVYIHQRLMQESPMTFSTLPIRLREKVIGMNLFVIILVTLGLVEVLADYLLESIITPGLYQATDWKPIWSIISLNPRATFVGCTPLSPIDIELMFLNFVILFPLFGYVLMWLNASYIRNGFVGFVAFFSEIIALSITYALITMILISSPLENLITQGSLEGFIAIFTTLWSVGWSALAIYLLSRRLRTIPS